MIIIRQPIPGLQPIEQLKSSKSFKSFKPSQSNLNQTSIQSNPNQTHPNPSHPSSIKSQSNPLQSFINKLIKPISMSLHDFEIMCKLGEGTYSTVYKARRLSDNQHYAIKKVKITNLSEKEKKNALSEIRIMASISHPNIVGYKEAFFDESDNSLCLIMEFADSGDLWQKIQRSIKRSTRLSEKTIWSIFIQMTRGLKALHDLNVFHRDLKSANVFLNQDGSVKIGDMNVSKVAKDGFLRTQTGTPYYASPEVWKDLKYNNKSDIWSLGCVLYESIALRPPFRAKDMEELYEKVIAGLYDPIPKNYSKDLSFLLKHLLNTNPTMRPSCSEILNFESVKRHAFAMRDSSSSACLISTIKVPKEIKNLAGSLPRAKYECTEPESEENRFYSELKRVSTEDLIRPAVRRVNAEQTTESNSKKKHNSLLIDEKAMMVDSIILPKVKPGLVGKLKRHDIHKIIQHSTERLKRIKEIYLSPTSIALTPQAKKSVRSSVIRKNILYE